MEKYCQNCRQQNAPNAQFCRFCAAPLVGAQSGGQQAQNQANFNNQQWNQGFQGNQQAPQFVQHSTGTSGRAIASLMLSIFGLLLCCALTSIPGAILGWMEVSAIKEGRSSQSGLRTAQVGMWSGIAISIVNFLFYGFYFLALLSSGAMYY
jgi:hypothetical protein